MHGIVLYFLAQVDTLQGIFQGQVIFTQVMGVADVGIVTRQELS